MGRELRRVSVDFEWPLHKVWMGFLNDTSSGTENCEACKGRGTSPFAEKIHDQWYGAIYEDSDFVPEMTGSTPFPWNHPRILAMAERNVLGSPKFYGLDELTYLKEGLQEYQPIDKAKIPLGLRSVTELKIKWEGERLAEHFNASMSHHLTQDDVDTLIAEGRLQEFKDKNPTAAEVNAWSLGGMGHDSINQWIVTERRCVLAGADYKCDVCKGRGFCVTDLQEYKAHSRWKPTEPPSGNGYQIWETVSEGSPVSPVFATAEELAAWMCTIGNDTSVTKGGSFESWMKFINGPGWMPSMIVTSDGKVRSGPDMLS